MAREIRDEGGVALAHGLDVRDAAAARMTFDAIAAAWKGLDILVCAAGILRSGQLATMDLAVWDEVQNVNVKGVLIACQQAIRLMQAEAQPGARRKIAVVASASAFAPKVGLGAIRPRNLRWSRSCACWRPNWRRRASTSMPSRPARSRRPMVQDRLAGANDGSGFKLYGAAPVGRMGQPKDVADAIAYLCSPEADFVTGSVLSIDGGTTAVFQV